MSEEEKVMSEETSQKMSEETSQKKSKGGLVTAVVILTGLIILVALNMK